MSSVIVTGSGVIHSRTRASLECTLPATARMRSRSVKIPIIRPKSETTTAPTPSFVIFSAASPIVSEGSTVRTSFVMTSPSVGVGASVDGALARALRKRDTSTVMPVDEGADVVALPELQRREPATVELLQQLRVAARAGTGAARGAENLVSRVLFVDLVGFTARSDRADPEDVRRGSSSTTRQQARIEQYGGVVEKFIGDAVMAVFGAPAAHGDDAERAVRAGLPSSRASGSEPQPTGSTSPRARR